MPFDPLMFEAEIALKLIPTEQLPLRAQDALEAGYDGPRTVRLAILESKSLSEIDSALRQMVTELGITEITPPQAAIRLATIRAKYLLDSGEDPLPSLPYFYRLLQAGDYPEELCELAYLADEWEYLDTSIDEQQRCTIEALQNLLDPELRQQRSEERLAEWQRQREAAQHDWPYVFNSPAGRTLLKDRYKDRVKEMRPVLAIEAIAWAILGWAYGWWKVAMIGYVVTIPLLLLLAYWAAYRQLKQERRQTLWRLGVPDDKI
jgi:hypothetical protein